MDKQGAVLRIKALSFLLFNLQKQLDPPTRFHHDSKELTAYSAIATLLTRGKGDASVVAVMGTGISPSGIQISAAESIESTEGSTSIIESQSSSAVALAVNSNKKKSSRQSINSKKGQLEVTAFDLSLTPPFDFESLVLTSNAKIDLKGHATDVLGALKGLSSPEFKDKSRRMDRVLQIKQFCLVRSFRKISSRFDAGNQVASPIKSDQPVTPSQIASSNITEVPPIEDNQPIAPSQTATSNTTEVPIKDGQPIAPSQTATSNFIKVLEGIQFDSKKAIILPADPRGADEIDFAPFATISEPNTTLLYELPRFMAGTFKQRLVPHRIHEGRTVFDLAIHTLPAWNAVLVTVLKRIQDLLSLITKSSGYTNDSAKPVDYLSLLLSGLNAFARTPAFIAFLNQTDIKESLREASKLKQKYDKEVAEAQRKEWLNIDSSVAISLDHDTSMSSNNSDASDASDAADSDDSADLVMPDGATYHQFLQWVKNFTAWAHAVDILASEPLLFSTIPIRVAIVKPPVPDKQMIPLRTIVDEALSRFSKITEMDKSRLISFVKNVVGDIFHAVSNSVLEGGGSVKSPESYWENGEGFTGSVHCEATLCALRYASEKSELKSYEDELANAEEVERMFKRFSSSVGVAKKHCWCCSRLASELASDLQNNKFFISKGAHNIIFPWAPPTVGIPLKVLRNMEEQLSTKLFDVLAGVLRSFGVVAVSRQSTPESDDLDGMEVDKERDVEEYGNILDETFKFE